MKTLARKRKCLCLGPTKHLSGAYITWTFKYCHLWIICGKTENKLINEIHRRTLQLIQDTKDAEDGTFEDLLERDTYYSLKFTKQHITLAHQ